jgi:hypothetical protein
MKLLILSLSLFLLGCQTTTIRMSSLTMDEAGRIIEKNTMDIESVPRDWHDVYFSGYNVILRAGAAAVAADPWAEIVGEIAGPAIQAAICAQNPLLCNTQEN